MSDISRKALLNIIETKRLQLIESDDDSGADMLEMWIDEIEQGDFYIPSTESEGEATSINPIIQAIRDFMPTAEQRPGYEALIAWLESTTPFTLREHAEIAVQPNLTHNDLFQLRSLVNDNGADEIIGLIRSISIKDGRDTDA